MESHNGRYRYDGRIHVCRAGCWLDAQLHSSARSFGARLNPTESYKEIPGYTFQGATSCQQTFRSGNKMFEMVEFDGRALPADVLE